jgi:hypothetical protein
MFNKREKRSRIIRKKNKLAGRRWCALTCVRRRGCHAGAEEDGTDERRAPELSDADVRGGGWWNGPGALSQPSSCELFLPRPRRVSSPGSLPWLCFGRPPPLSSLHHLVVVGRVRTCVREGNTNEELR